MTDSYPMPTHGLFQDLTGRRFGKWTVLSYAGRTHNSRKSHWLCRCDCGNTRRVRSGHLLSGRSTSCGCFRAENATTHGEWGSPAYQSWENMIQRCTNPNTPFFKHYGGRGITVCTCWRSFENFYADMGDRPDDMEIDRIDNDGDYEPGNCRWATRKQQQRNTRRTHLLTLDGRTQCISAWAEELGMHHHVIRDRINRGWSAKRALTAPVA